MAILLVWSLPLSAAPKGDEFEEGLREVFKLYQEKNYDEVSAKMRALLQMLEEREASKDGEPLPAKLSDWQSGQLKREDLALLGGGTSLQRTYYWGVKTVTFKLVTGSPVIKSLVPIFKNKDLLEASGRKVHTVLGERAVVENERKLQMLIEGRILLEATGNEHTEESEVLALTRKLNAKVLREMK